MALLEKIRMWWRLHFRTVKIYTHLQELIAELRAAGLSQRANEVEETLKAGSFAAELLEAETILLRNIVKEETLSPSLKRKIRRIQIESWGILSRILHIDASEVVSSVRFSPAPKSIVHPEVDYTRAHKWVGDDHCDEDFCFVKCRICGKFALMDEEIDTIYLRADNPCNAHLYGIAASVKCPNCGSSDSFEDTSENDAQAIRESEWAEFLRDGARFCLSFDDQPSCPVEIVYADHCIQVIFPNRSGSSLRHLSADTLTFSVIRDSGLLAGIDAYTPSTCWLQNPELNMPEVSRTYRCHISADFDANGIASLCDPPDKRIIWQYSDKNKVLRAVFEDRTERLYAIAPNLMIGVCSTNNLSEVLFGGIFKAPK